MRRGAVSDGAGWRWGVAGLALWLLAGCAQIPGVEERLGAARVLAQEGRLDAFAPAAEPLPLAGFARLGCPGTAVNVYIEGDGLAWLGIGQPSPDPTPLNPVALRLAAADGGCNVVYLGRPGQFRAGTVAPRYWQGARFAPEVVASYVAALRPLALSRQAPRLRLTGYSGGAAVAALVAARLQQEGVAVELVTVAGNLDTAAWTARRKLTPLKESLNPADEAGALATVPQLHLVGRRDRQVPSWVLDAFLARLGSRDCVRVVEVDAEHGGPWDEAYRQALAQSPVCHPPSG